MPEQFAGLSHSLFPPPSPSHNFSRTVANMTAPNAARTGSHVPPSRQRSGDATVEPSRHSTTNRAPRLETTTRSTPNDSVEIAPGHAPLSRHHLNTLGTLRDLLDDLNDSETLASMDVIHFFACLKGAEKSEALPTVIRDHPKARELSRLNKALTRFLHRLNEELNPQENTEALDSSAWTVEQLRAVFLGLAACANPRCGPVFAKDQLERVCPSLQGITCALMELVAAKDLPDSAESASVVLDIMNWLGRGLKSRLIAPSPDINAFAPKFVAALLDWSAPKVGTSLAENEPVASLEHASIAPDKNPHQIGKCAAQVYPIYRFRLLGPDQAAYANLKRLALNLCSETFLNRLEAKPMDVVAVINLTNMVKDSLDRGLLSAADPQLATIVPRLLNLVARIPSAELTTDGGRTAGNCSNFLRTLLENKLAGYADLAAAPKTSFASACKAVLAVAKAPAGCNAHTTSNLLSFVKAFDKCLPLPAEGTAIQPGSMQHEVVVAASNVIANAVKLGAQTFVRTEALGGLLAGLAHFAARKSPMLEGAVALMHALMRAVAQIGKAQWSTQSRGNTLRAMEILLGEKIFAIEDMEEALQVLLGQCSDPGGVWSAASLHRAASRLGVIRDVVVPLPPLTSLPQVVEPPPEDTKYAVPPSPAIPRPRPGDTPIVPERPPQASTTAKPKKKSKTKTKNKSREATTTAARLATGAVPTSAPTAATATLQTDKPSIHVVPAPIANKPGPAAGLHAARPLAPSSSAAALVASAPSLVSRGGHQGIQVQASPLSGMTEGVSSSDEKEAGKAGLNAHTRAENTKAAPTKAAHTKAATTNASTTKAAHAKAATATAKATPPPGQLPKPAVAAANTTASGSVTSMQKDKPARITPRQQWFELLKNNSDPLKRLEALATANPQLLNLKDTQDKSGRAAIFYAITRGHADVVAWLMEQERHRVADAPGAFLNTVLDAIGFEEPEIIEALDAFLDAAVKGQCVRSAAELKSFSREKARQLHEVSRSLQIYGLLESNSEASPAVNRRSRLQSSESLADIESTLLRPAKPAAKPKPFAPEIHVSSSAKSRRDALPELLLPGEPDELRSYLEKLDDPDESLLLAHAQALIMALNEKKPALARVLIEHRGGEIVERCLHYELRNPLSAAVMNDDVDNLRRLIQYGDRKLLEPEYSQDLPLLVAMYHLRPECAEILIDSVTDAQLEVAGGDGWSALTLAASIGAEAVVEKLIARMPELAVHEDRDGKTPLDHATQKKHAGIIRLLQAVVPPEHISRNIAASSPAQRVAADWTKLVSNSQPGPMSLMSNDISTLAKFLVENPTPDGSVLSQCVNALNLALIVQNHEMCAALIEYQNGAILELLSRHCNPLINAANLHPKTFRLILDYQGGKLLEADGVGNTPLQASILGNIYNADDCSRLLMAEMDDAHLAWTNPRGENALTHAAMQVNEKIARLLFARLPALAKQPDIDGRTPLDHAVIGGHTALVNFFASQ